MVTIVKGPSGHKRRKCQACLVTVEYAPNEVKERHGRDISGGPDGETYVECPNCGARIIITRW